MQFSSVKQFETQDLSVPGAQVIKSPVYSDLRGSLYESFHILKLRWTTSVDTLDGVYPGKNTLYGPCAHGGEELLYLIRGKLLVYLVDINDHSKREKLEVVPGMVIRIPANAIHAFYSLDESTIFNLARNEPEGEIKKFSAVNKIIAHLIITVNVDKDSPLDVQQMAELCVEYKDKNVVGFATNTKELDSTTMPFFQETFNYLRRNFISVSMFLSIIFPSFSSIF